MTISSTAAPRIAPTALAKSPDPVNLGIVPTPPDTLGCEAIREAHTATFKYETHSSYQCLS